MTTTLVGLYDAALAAAEAQQKLLDQGLPGGELHTGSPTPHGQRLTEHNQIVQRLITQGVPADEAKRYAQGVHQGGALVVVQMPDMAASRGLAILNQWQPITPPPAAPVLRSEEGDEPGPADTAAPQSRGFLGGLGVKELGKRVVKEIQKDDCSGRAAQLAYYLIFAIFPFLLFLSTLLGYIPIPNLMNTIMDYLTRLLPSETATMLRNNLQQLLSQQQGGLLSFSILATLWTASSAVVAITSALNLAYDVQEGRPFWKVRGIAMLITLGLSLFIIGSMILLIFGPQLGAWIASMVGLGQVFTVLWNILRWPVIVVLLIVAMAVVYYWTPDVEQQWKWITPGAAFAIIGTILISLGFSFYVNNFGSYNATYGSIGAVIVFLTWLYLSGFVVLIGGEINAEIEHAAPQGKDPGEKTVS